jgi:hypothetical protein
LGEDVRVRRVSTGEALVVAPGRLAEALCRGDEFPVGTAVSLDTEADLMDVRDRTVQRATLSAGFPLTRVFESENGSWYVRTPNYFLGWIEASEPLTPVPATRREFGWESFELCHPLVGEHRDEPLVLTVIPARTGEHADAPHVRVLHYGIPDVDVVGRESMTVFVSVAPEQIEDVGDIRLSTTLGHLSEAAC